MNIVLIGYRGSGKSATGHILAQHLGWGFTDTDTVIEGRSGMTIRDIYADQAEEGFRDLETQVVAEVATLDRYVISTGGGAVLRPDNAVALKRNGKLVWLAASADILWERISKDSHRERTRPRTAASAGLEQVRESLREREPTYAGWADFALDTTDLSPDAVADAIMTRLGMSRRTPTPVGSGV